MRLGYAWLLTVLLAVSPAARGEWKAGVARVKITPGKPMWMSGYASRDRPAEGTLIDLWAKALALDDGEGHRAVLTTMDKVRVVGRRGRARSPGSRNHDECLRAI